MNKYSLKKFICEYNDTITGAMKKIDINAKGIVYIVDRENRLIGSLSDGDIRRWILKKGGLDGNVSEACYRNVKYLYIDKIHQSKDFMRKNKIKSIPIVDKNDVIVEILFMEDTADSDGRKYSSELENIPIIIMAGGKGTRLYPYTRILPKPLIPIGGVPIIERILNRFYEHGAKEFYLTVNYKKEIIKAYFKEINPPYLLRYIEEVIPLGTAGSIKLIKKQFSSPVIVTNCDTLIELNYKNALQHHVSSQNDMTIISSLKNIVIPYGVLETKERGVISSMHEKPQLSYMINTGMYIINPEFLNWIPENRIFHMTDLAEKMMKADKQVGMYPISENSFLDMGEFEEMKKMEERINNGSDN